MSVADTGVGIAPEDQARVFEQFGQAGDTLTDKPRGTGLGLPICREIVEHHGGRLWLESEPGRVDVLVQPAPGRGRNGRIADRRSVMLLGDLVQGVVRVRLLLGACRAAWTGSCFGRTYRSISAIGPNMMPRIAQSEPIAAESGRDLVGVDGADDPDDGRRTTNPVPTSVGVSIQA